MKLKKKNRIRILIEHFRNSILEFPAFPVPRGYPVIGHLQWLFLDIYIIF